MFWRKTRGIPRCPQSSMKWAALRDDSENRIPWFARDPDRIAVEVGEAADEGGAVELLELVQAALVHDPGDDLPHLVGPARVVRDDAPDLGRVIAGRRGLAHVERNALSPVEVGHAAPRDGEGVVVVEGVVVGDPGLARVHVRPAQLLRGHHLADRGLHERRAAEKDGPLLADDDALVAHRGHVGATRGARAHDDRDLGDRQRRHVRLVVEGPSEVLAVREHLVLEGEERATRVHEIDAGQVVLEGDLLGAEVLLDAHRVVGAALHRRVVRDHHALDPAHPADPGDEARGRHVAAVHVPRGELGELEEGSARVEELAHPVAGEELSAVEVTLAGPFAAAPLDHRHLGAEVLDERGHRFGVRAKLGGPRVHAALDDGHRVRLPLSPARASRGFRRFPGRARAR